MLLEIQVCTEKTNYSVSDVPRAALLVRFDVSAKEVNWATLRCPQSSLTGQASVGHDQIVLCPLRKITGKGLHFVSTKPIFLSSVKCPQINLVY